MNNQSESSSLDAEYVSVRDNLWAPMMQFEEGRLPMAQVVVWFTMLIETGYIWKLPPQYMDSAVELIENGFIGSPDREVN